MDITSMEVKQDGLNKREKEEGNGSPYTLK
jgi:hypothetical protein